MWKVYDDNNGQQKKFDQKSSLSLQLSWAKNHKHNQNSKYFEVYGMTAQFIGKYIVFVAKI